MLHAREDYNGRIVDLLKKIPENEPVFLLRAQDVVAPEVVEYWVAKARAHGAGKNILNAAERQVGRMRKWQKGHGMKVPDMPS